MRAWLPASLALTLCACGSGGDPGGTSVPIDTPPPPPPATASGLDQVPDHGFCDFLAGGTVTIETEPGCTGCSVENEHLAIDGDPKTFATVRTDATPARTGAIVLRGSAPAGIEYPAGALPGVALSWPIGTAALSVGFEVRAYRGTTQTDYTQFYGIRRSAGSSEQILLSTQQAYDSVGFALLPYALPEAMEVRVHELCARGD